MRRFLIPALLVNLAGLPAVAQEAPERARHGAHETIPAARSAPDRNSVDWQRPAPQPPALQPPAPQAPVPQAPTLQPISNTPPYAPPSDWGDRDPHHRDGSRGWDRSGGRDRNHDDRYDRNDQNWRDRDGYDRWRRDWRQDRRFDWRRYRDMHRPHYRKPHYQRPFGYSYGYRRLGIGVYLDRVFYAPGYWINDPWAYRLPRAYGSLRWVRYYKDVILVDLRNGRIVDVIYDVFW